MSMILFVVIVLGSWAYLIIKNDDLFEVFNERNLGFLDNFIQKMFGKGAKQIAYTDKSRWIEVLKLTVDTIAMSFLANGLAMIGTLITVVPAAANYADGRLTGRKNCNYSFYIYYYTICAGISLGNVIHFLYPGRSASGGTGIGSP